MVDAECPLDGPNNMEVPVFSVQMTLAAAMISQDPSTCTRSLSLVIRFFVYPIAMTWSFDSCVSKLANVLYLSLLFRC